MTRFLIATILFLAVLGVMLTSGMRMPAPPRWYVERLRLASDAGRHAGLLVSEDIAGTGAIELEPAEARPVYLLKPGPGQPSLPMPPLPLPRGYVVELKMEQQRIFYWQPHYPEGQRWVESGAALPFELGLDNFVYADAFQRHPIPNSPDRPADIVPPPSQRRLIRLVVGRQPATLPVELRYDLNPEYDRQLAAYHSAVWSQRWERLLAVGLIVVAGLVALLAIAGLAFTSWLAALATWELASLLFGLLGMLLALPLRALRMFSAHTRPPDS